MLSAKKPTEKRAEAAAAAAKMEAVEARLVVRLPESLHRTLKVHVAKEGTTIQAYLTALLQNDLGSKASR